MSCKLLSPPLLLIFLAICLSILKSTAYENIGIGGILSGAAHPSRGQLAVFWGQNDGEDRLIQTCKSLKYNIIIIGYLSAFGGGRKPALNFLGHCDPSNGGCHSLTHDIKRCQVMGIKILLPLGGPPGNYSLGGAGDAHKLANYLFHNFFQRTNGSRLPFGNNVKLDGINLDIRGGHDLYYPELLKKLSSMGVRIRLSVSSPCLFPPKRLFASINTSIIDYAMIKFYNVESSPDSCEYDPEDVNAYKRAWKWWTSKPIKKVFFGTLASVDAGFSGYIPPKILRSDILPFIRQSKRYGGVMLWNRFYDKNTFVSYI